MSLQRRKSLVNTLQNLLKQQIDFARQGQISTVQELSTKTSFVAEQIAIEKILEMDEFKIYKKQLQKAYEDLSMALKVQKNDVAEKVSQIKKGKKTVRAYKKNI